MMTTWIEAPTVERVIRDAPPAKPSATVPRHVAIALAARRTERCSVSFDAAAAALRVILSGCLERGVAVLTLIRPEISADVFDAAFSAARSAVVSSSGLKVNLSARRDGRDELLEAVRELAIQSQRGEIEADAIGAENIERGLSTRGLPPVDLLIATGGGGTLCGALLWQCAYAELLFLDAPWFEFGRADFDAALGDYAKRCRKFGGLA